MSDLFFTQLCNSARRHLMLAQGARLFSRGDPVTTIYLLQSGSIALHRHQADGADFLLHRAKAGDLVAEASLYSAHYHCDGDCLEAAELALLAKQDVLQMLRDDAALSQAWAARLAGALQKSRQQAELLRRRKVADRVAGWLDWNGSLPPKGRWKDLAAELGVTPEALYRALRSMRLG